MCFLESRVCLVYFPVTKCFKRIFGEAILDGWDQTVWKSNLKQRSYVIFVILLNLGKTGSEHLLVFSPTISHPKFKRGDLHGNVKLRDRDTTFVKISKPNYKKKLVAVNRLVVASNFRDFPDPKIVIFYLFFESLPFKTHILSPKISLEAQAL